MCAVAARLLMQMPMMCQCVHLQEQQDAQFILHIWHATLCLQMSFTSNWLQDMSGKLLLVCRDSFLMVSAMNHTDMWAGTIWVCCTKYSIGLKRLSDVSGQLSAYHWLLPSCHSANSLACCDNVWPCMSMMAVHNKLKWSEHMLPWSCLVPSAKLRCFSHAVIPFMVFFVCNSLSLQRRKHIAGKEVVCPLYFPPYFSINLPVCRFVTWYAIACKNSRGRGSCNCCCPPCNCFWLRCDLPSAYTRTGQIQGVALYNTHSC